MYLHVRKLLAIALVLSLSACLEEIELAIETTEPRLVVGGEITTDPGPYTVELAISAKFASGAAGIPDRVTGASIVMKDDAGNEAVLTETGEGIYQTNPADIQGTIGRSYFLEIETGGKTYLSRPEKILPINSPENISIQNIEERELNEAGNFVDINRVKVFVDTYFPSDTAYLRWKTFGIYEFNEIGSQGNLNPNTCYVTEQNGLDNVVVASAINANSEFLEQKEVLSRNIDYRYALRYCMNVIQQSITQETYDFWSAVAEEFERSGNIFETPPGKIRGNIYNPSDLQEEVLGIFSASAVDTMQLLIQPAEVGTPNPLCRPFPTPGETCFNCLLLPNSTLEKPSCWQ